MAEFFGKVRGALSCYCDDNDGMLTDARFVLCRFGEDPDKVVEAFWREYEGSQAFSIIPLFARGEAPPRRELCTQESLLEALRTVRIEPGSFIEMKWKELCEQMAVAWPKRLQGKAA
jgi:hypothetical protein